MYLHLGAFFDIFICFIFELDRSINIKSQEYPAPITLFGEKKFKEYEMVSSLILIIFQYNLVLKIFLIFP